MVSFPQVSPPKPCTHLSSPPFMLHGLPISFFYTQTTLGEEYRSLCFSLSSFLHSPVASSLLDPNILLNTLFSNTLSLHSSLNMSDQVPHPHKTTGKIIVLYHGAKESKNCVITSIQTYRSTEGCNSQHHAHECNARTKIYPAIGLT